MINVGERVKSSRTKQGLTLKELSEKTGLSVSYLSQFERGLSTVALDSLMRIAEALNEDVYDYIRGISAKTQDRDDVVLKSYQRLPPQIMPESTLQTELSAYGGDKKMMVRMITLLPKENPERLALTQHDGEEFLYVLEGALTLEVDSVRYILYPEDTAHFNSQREHMWYNETNRNVRFIIVNYPYYPNK